MAGQEETAKPLDAFRADTVRRREVAEANRPGTTKIRANIEPLLVGATGAAKLMGMGRSLWYRLGTEGRTPLPLRLGGKVLWRVEELRAWVRAGCPSRARWEKMPKSV